MVLVGFEPAAFEITVGNKKGCVILDNESNVYIGAKYMTNTI